MQLSKAQFQILVASLFLLSICLFVPQNKETTFPHQSKTDHPFDLDTTLLFQRKVIQSRLPKFIYFLNQHSIPIHNEYELLLLLSNPFTRQRISHQIQVGSNVLLFHAELADLLELGMTELDAQILLFSQRNYQNPFTGEMMNLQVLAEANAEKLLEDIGGWMAGNENELLQNYTLSLNKIQSWIDKAQGREFKVFAEML